MDKVTLADPRDARLFFVGDEIVFTGVPRWRTRAWRWIRRVILRRPPIPPTAATIVSIDEESGTITVDCE